VLYADRITDSMQQAIDETDRRRTIQKAYNEENGITPASITKPLDMSLARIVEADYLAVPKEEDDETALPANPQELLAIVEKLEKQMREAAKAFEFEKAADLRDRIKALKTRDIAGLAEAS
jgi:excinuclease ABC subunit B